MVRPNLARPNARFLLAHPAHFLALGFGTGLAPVAPGTVGTLLGFPIYAMLADRLAPAELLGAIAGMFALGIWACGRTGRDIGMADHGAMNWDEVVAFPVWGHTTNLRATWWRSWACPAATVSMRLPVPRTARSLPLVQGPATCTG